MKTLSTLFIAAVLTSSLTASTVTKAKQQPKKDTLNLKCMLYSPELFYGMELGEKPVQDMVDTLVSEVPYYDSAMRLNLVIVSGRDLGFRGGNNIMWKDVLDSAQSRGYSVCPAQVAPELYSISQNVASRNLIKRRVSNGRPIFVGMNSLRHNLKDDIFLAFFKHKDYFNYIFCVKANAKHSAYELGYSVTDNKRDQKSYTWTSEDMFIFVNKPVVVKQQLCKN